MAFTKSISVGEKSVRVSDLQTTNNGLWIAAKLLVPTVYQADDGGSSNARSPHKIGTFLWEYVLFENIILPSKLDGGPLKALCECVKFIQNQEIREELRTTMRWTVCRYIRRKCQTYWVLSRCTVGVLADPTQSTGCTVDPQICERILQLSKYTLLAKWALKRWTIIVEFANWCVHPAIAAAGAKRRRIFEYFKMWILKWHINDERPRS